MRRHGDGERRESHPYVRWGIGAGVLGALVVALFFGVLDLMAGQPLGTPSRLGSALFLSEAQTFDPAEHLQPLMVLGYSLVHGALFVGLALTAASLLLGSPRPRRLPSPPLLTLLLTGVFFVGLAALSTGFWFLTGSWLWNVLGAERVAIANGLASFAMAATIAYAIRTRAQRSPDAPTTARPAGAGSRVASPSA